MKCVITSVASRVTRGIRSSGAQSLGNENSLHWVLVTFAEDASRIRKDNAPQNFSLLRHLAVNLLRQEDGEGSLAMKRYRAGLDNNYLAKVVAVEGQETVGELTRFEVGRKVCLWDSLG